MCYYSLISYLVLQVIVWHLSSFSSVHTDIDWHILIFPFHQWGVLLIHHLMVLVFFQALDQGLLGMAFTNGSPYVAPTRSNIAQNCCENPNQNVACTKNDKPDTNVTMIVKMRISGVQPHCSQPSPYLWLRQDLTETTCCLIWSDIDNNVSIVISWCDVVWLISEFFPICFILEV